MYDNIYFDLADRELLLVHLDYSVTKKGATSSSSASSSFSFKGKCMLGVLYGHVQINGYSIRNDHQSAPLKWFEVYSPETNAFLTIKTTTQARKRKADVTAAVSNNESMDTSDHCDHVKALIDRQLRAELNLDISSEIEASLIEFFTVRTQFNAKTSSVVALAALKSQMCNYLSYFPNFQSVYHTKSVPDDDANSRMAKLGIYPVANPNLVFNENDDLVAILNDILEGGHKNADVNETSISHAHPAPVIMACGGKDVGKSSLLRFTVNSLLNRFPKVAYIDCDPGQTEFTLGGCISIAFISEPLFGPPHTHIGHSNETKTSYFLGHLSPNDVPSLYLEYLRQCSNDLNAYMTKSKSARGVEKVPVVINTMGWNQGLGMCLLKESIFMFKPTHIIQINHPIEANKNMPVLDRVWLRSASGWPPTLSNNAAATTRSRGDANTLPPPPTDSNINDEDSNHLPNYKLYALKSAVSKLPAAVKKNFSPRDQRNVAVLAYFSRLQESLSTFVPIHHLRPYRIACSKICLHVSHARIDFSQLFHVFNASLVGLCRCDPKYIRTSRDNPELPSVIDMKNEPAKNLILKCFGFGIVRGISMENKEFYVLTPEPIEVLSQVNIMVKGMLNLPLEFFYEQDYRTSCPYMTFAAVDTNTNTNKIGKVESQQNAHLLASEPAQRKYLIHQSLASGNRN